MRGDGPQIQTFEVNGAPFTCHRLGAGPRTAVLLHGFPDDASSMHGLMHRLAARGYTCWAPYLRGYGPSAPAPGGDFTLHALGTDLLALMARLAPDGQPLDVIGHDWGALIAYTAAAIDPTPFRRLVGMGVAPTWPMTRAILRHPAQLRRSSYILFFQLRWLPERRIRRDGLAWIDTLWRRWSPGWTPPPDHLERVKQTLSADGSLASALAYYRALLPADPRRMRAYARTQRTHVMEKISPPTLIIAGERDGCAGPACYTHVASAFVAPPQIELLADCGHFPHLERAEETGERVTAFLSA